jgi:hypothetical protein
MVSSEINGELKKEFNKTNINKNRILLIITVVSITFNIFLLILLVIFQYGNNKVSFSNGALDEEEFLEPSLVTEITDAQNEMQQTVFSDSTLKLAFNYPSSLELERSNLDNGVLIYFKKNILDQNNYQLYTISFTYGEDPKLFLFGTSDYLFQRNVQKDKKVIVGDQEYTAEYYLFDNSEPGFDSDGKEIYRFSIGDFYLIKLRSDLYLSLDSTLVKTVYNGDMTRPDISIPLSDLQTVDSILKSVKLN